MPVTTQRRPSTGQIGGARDAWEYFGTPESTMPSYDGIGSITRKGVTGFRYLQAGAGVGSF